MHQLSFQVETEFHDQNKENIFMAIGKCADHANNLAKP
jgi:hypothetical protein